MRSQQRSCKQQTAGVTSMFPIQYNTYWLQQDNAKTELTCNRGLDVQHGFLLPEDGGPLIYDAQGDRLLHTAFFCEVSLQQVNTRLPLAVKHLPHTQPVAQRERDR